MSEGISRLKARIAEEMKRSLKAGEKLRLGTLRMLSAAVTVREKDVLHELSDDEVREVAAKEIKRRNEAIEAYEAAGREDLAGRERAEREILAAYAPEHLPDEAVDALIDEAIAATGASGPRDLGKVMGSVMEKARGKADGATVQKKVRARLGG